MILLLHRRENDETEEAGDDEFRRSVPSASDDEAALLRLWREKRGEVESEDLSDNLIVQLGNVTEELNRRWYRF